VKTGLKVVGVILLLIVASIGIKMCAFPMAAIKNGLDTPREINNAVMNAENAMHNYEWFKQQEADIRRLVKQETNHISTLERFKEMLPGNRSDWDREDKAEYGRLSANITAQKDMVNKAMEDYNAASSMVTKNIFKDNLPSNLSRSWYAQKNLIFQ